MLKILFKVYDKNNNLKSYIVDDNNKMFLLPKDTNLPLEEKFTVESLREGTEGYNRILKEIIRDNIEDFIICNDINQIHSKFNRRFCFDTIYNKITTYSRKAIALIGARRTGKTVLLEQIIEELLLKQNYIEDNIVYLTIRQSCGMTDLMKYVLEINKTKDIKILVIDEISNIYDFVINGNGITDYCSTHGIKLLLSGTYSAVLELSRKDACLGRLECINTTFISFKEFMFLRKNIVHTIEEKAEAVDKFIKSGFVLDNLREKDNEDFINTSVVINIAKALIQSEEVPYFEHINFEDEDAFRELKEIILKYFKYLSTDRLLDEYYKKLSSEDLSKPLNNLKRRNAISKKLSNIEKSSIMNNAIKRQFNSYNLLFEDCKIIPPDKNLIKAIEDLLDNLNLVNGIYEIQNDTKELNTIGRFQGYYYDFIVALVLEDLRESTNKFTPKEITLIKETIEQTNLGVLLEEIINLEKMNLTTLEGQPKKLENLNLTVRRKTPCNLDKLRINCIDKYCAKEIDLIERTENTLKLYEIKHSKEYAPHQHRWLEDIDILNKIKSYYGSDYTIERYVLYYGESMEILSELKDWYYIKSLGEFKYTQEENPETIKIKYLNIYDFLMELPQENYDWDKRTLWYYNGISQD